MLVKGKISIAFVIVGFILLLSSLIAIYEFVSMRNSVSDLVTKDVERINASGALLEVVDGYNFKLMENLPDSTAVLPMLPDIHNQLARKHFDSEEEPAMADSVKYAYIAYAHLVAEVPEVWKGDYEARRDWFFYKLYPVYHQLRGYIGKLDQLSQQALKGNSAGLNDAFYRSLMPCVVSVAIGILLLLLFNYFLNYYFINPLSKITRALKRYSQTHKTYDVNLESNDEMQDLNDNLKELIRENKQLLKGNESK